MSCTCHPTACASRRRPQTVLGGLIRCPQKCARLTNFVSNLFAAPNMSKSKRKQTQPIAAAAPTAPELSPSREDNHTPVQSATLSFKRTRSSQVISYLFWKTIQYAPNMLSSQCGAFLLNFCGFLPPVDSIGGKGPNELRKLSLGLGVDVAGLLIVSHRSRRVRRPRRHQALARASRWRQCCI
jgi:hypothetical protein